MSHSWPAFHANSPAQGLSAEGPLQMASRLHSPIWSPPSEAGVTSLKELHPPKLTSWLPLPTVPSVRLQGDTGSRATHKLGDSNYHALTPRLLVTRPMPGTWSARSWSRKRILALQQRSSLSRGSGFLQIQEQQTSADHLTKGSASQKPESHHVDQRHPRGQKDKGSGPAVPNHTAWEGHTSAHNWEAAQCQRLYCLTIKRGKENSLFPDYIPEVLGILLPVLWGWALGPPQSGPLL